MEEKTRISIEETSLEDLIMLGEEKLIDCIIQYPTETGNIQAKAKIKQLTMKQLKNIDLTRRTLETNVKILEKALYKQDGTPYTTELILNLPVGVVNALTHKIMEISGVDPNEIKKY